MLACEGFRIQQQGAPDAFAIRLLADGKVTDMAVEVAGKKVGYGLQVHKAQTLTIAIVLCDKHEGTRRLVLEMSDQIAADTFNHHISLAPFGQVEVNETFGQSEDEVIVVRFGSADENFGITSLDVHCRNSEEETRLCTASMTVLKSGSAEMSRCPRCEG